MLHAGNIFDAKLEAEVPVALEQLSQSENSKSVVHPADVQQAVKDARRRRQTGRGTPPDRDGGDADSHLQIIKKIY